MSESQAGNYKTRATQKGIIAGSDGKPMLSTEAPCPPFDPESAQVYVRTEAVAINPSDTKMKGDFVTPHGLFGADFAGTVVAVGAGVQGIQIGNRIAGAQYSMHASMPDHGAFGEYNVTNGAIWLKLPPSMSTEAGATLGAGISTTGLAIRALGLPLPDEPLPEMPSPPMVLVYGGSTATGTLAIQLLRM